MNVLTLTKYSYKIKSKYNALKSTYEITFSCSRINDFDGYYNLTKVELEELRDNLEGMLAAIDGVIE